jgi:hypothetical protein
VSVLVLGFVAGVLFSSGVWTLVWAWRRQSRQGVADEVTDWLAMW